MRIITGDECGLLKEVIPELCRPSSSLGGLGASSTSSASPSATAIHAGRARPSATSIQAAASSYGNQFSSTAATKSSSSSSSAVSRLEPNPESIGRDRGIASLAFLPSSSGGGQGEFDFAALRMNGIVETWSGNRITTSYDGDDEANVTAASYKKSGGLVKSVILKDEKAEKDDGNEDAISSSAVGKNGEDVNNSNGNSSSTSSSKGWYNEQPVRPIGMVSNYNATQSNTNNSQTSNNPILATCDSIGTISILNTNQLSNGVVSTYNAFDNISSSTLPSPSSSKNAIGRGTLTYTKGRFANNNIATSIAICGSGTRLGVGGRERGMRVVDLESGKLIWKAKNLPPDPQTLLQQPMWTTSIQFLHTPTSALASSSSIDGSSIPTNLVATGTAYKQVQIYDVRISSSSSASTRRPVLYTPEHLLTHRITTLCQLPNGNTLAVGDTTGDCHLLDMRKFHSGKQYTAKNIKRAKEEIGLGRLVGPGGSIRQLAMHPTLPYLACVGLDRKLWTWDVTKRKMMDCIYLRQRLNCLLFCDDGSWKDVDDEGAPGGEDGDGDRGQYDEGVEEGEMEDEVEDYIDSDEDGVKITEARRSSGGSSKQSKENSSSSEETESESGADAGNDDEGSTSEEEVEEANPKKRRKK